MFLRDLRYAVRSLAATRGFTFAAVLSLALGIGGNVAMFSLVNTVLLKPLAYPESEKLVFIKEVLPKIRHLYPSVGVPVQHFDHWRNELRSFQDVGAFIARSATLAGDGTPEKLGGAAVSSSLFTTLAIQPRIGRWFTRAEEQPGAPAVVVLSDSLWRRRYASDPGILGRKVLLGNEPHEVVGIAPPGLPFSPHVQLHKLAELPDRIDFLLPTRFSAEQLSGAQQSFDFGVIARLAPGYTQRQAEAEIASVMANLSRQSKQKYEMQAIIEPLHGAITGASRQGLLFLLGAVGLILLIVCVNVANLTLVRASGKRRELAIRSALGAGRGQLIGHSLAESVLLSAAGGMLGVVGALWMIDAVLTWTPAQLPRMEETSIDTNVLVFALALCAVTALLAGLLPALRTAQVSAAESLNSASRGNTDGPQGGRLRASLVSLEVALSTVLLISAGLLLASFHRVTNVDRGFESENILSVTLTLPGSQYEKRADQNRFFRETLRSVAAQPGVVHAGLVSRVPLAGEGDISMVIVEGSPNVPVVERPIANYRKTTGSYFPTMGIPLRQGRLFQEEEKEMVAILSDAMAKRLWPGENPLGKRFQRFGGGDAWIKVIGIVGDVHYSALDREPDRVIYQPYWQRGASELSLVIRTAIPPSAIAAAIRSEVWKLDSTVPVPELVTMSRIVAGSVAYRRFQATLVAGFAAIALLLAAIGIYGVVSNAVLQRRAELGVRIALGATSADVNRLVLRQGMVPVFAGLALGLLAALAGGRLLASLLFSIQAHDPLTFIGVPLLLAVVAVLACWIPARRAARIDPMMALRCE